MAGNAAHAPKGKNRGTTARIGEKANSEERWKIHQQKTNCNLKYFVKCYCDPSGVAAPTKMPRPGQASGCTLIRIGEL
jgi:hypothetical protein